MVPQCNNPSSVLRWGWMGRQYHGGRAAGGTIYAYDCIYNNIHTYHILYICVYIYININTIYTFLSKYIYIYIYTPYFIHNICIHIHVYYNCTSSPIWHRSSLEKHCEHLQKVTKANWMDIQLDGFGGNIPFIAGWWLGVPRMTSWKPPFFRFQA